MNGPIRLGCHKCDREDFDGTEKIPPNWLDVAWVQSLEDSLRELESSDPSGNVFEWYTHLGTCPECQAEEK